MNKPNTAAVIAALQCIHDDAAHALGTDAEPQDRLSVARQDLEVIRETAFTVLQDLIAAPEATASSVASLPERARARKPAAAVYLSALRRIAETPKEGERCDGYAQCWDDEPGRAVEQIDALIACARAAIRRGAKAPASAFPAAIATNAET